MQTVGPEGWAYLGARTTSVRYGLRVTFAPSTTIGVSIPVPDPHGSFLQACRAEFGDPAAWDIPAHITLLPPTVLDEQTYAEFLAHCRKVASQHAPFDVVLRGTGTFRPVSDVVFMQVARGVSACEELEADLRSGPVRRELAYYYHPHVTIAHNVAAEALDRAFEELAHYGVVFAATSYHVYELGADEVWRPVHEFKLSGG